MKTLFRDTKRLPGAVWLLFLVRLILSAGAFVNPFMTLLLKEHIKLPESAVGLVLSLSAIASALGLFLGGKLGDIAAKPKLLALFQIATGIVFVLCGMIGFHPILTVLLLLSVFLLSSSWPILNSLVADITPQEQQKLAFSLLYWGNNIGFSIGPLVAGLLFNTAPLMLFWGNSLALFLAGVLSLMVTRSAPITLHVTHVSQRMTKSIFSILLERPLVLLFGLGAIASAFIYSQHTFSVPLLLNAQFGALEGPKRFGLLMSVNGLTVVIATIPVTFISKRWPTILAVSASVLMYGIGFFGYGFQLSVIGYAGLTVFWTIGEILGATNTNVFVAEKSPPEYRSRMNSFVSLCYTAGHFLGPAVMGSVIEKHSIVVVWPVLLVTGIASALYLFLLWRLFEKPGR